MTDKPASLGELSVEPTGPLMVLLGDIDAIRSHRSRRKLASKELHLLAEEHPPPGLNRRSGSRLFLSSD